jgi:pyridoxine 5-phosphate synthase
MLKLGLNVDHVATLRQARLARYPDPVDAALAAQRAGASAITVHLREDRRHIQDDDLFRIREAIEVHLNQEMAPIPEMLDIAMELRPDEVCIVPERREELTTEGGLDAAGLTERLRPIVDRLKMSGIGVSLFVDPEPHQVEAAAMLGADFIEIHTGTYANLADADIVEWKSAGASDGRRPSRAPSIRKPRQASIRTRSVSILDALGEETRAELRKVQAAVKLARSLKLKPNAGHGLNYDNVAPIAAIPGLVWLHIGHSIVSRAVITGMERAVRDMIALLNPRSAAAASRRRGSLR